MREWLELVTEYAILIIDWMALLIVIYAAIEAFIQAARLVVLKQETLDARLVWLRFSRLLVAALTFQLAADIIETSISADWESLGRIAVVALIRTFLNYFLEKDVREIGADGGTPAKV
jgi:uncharacterized membrane protein